MAAAFVLEVAFFVAFLTIGLTVFLTAFFVSFAALFTAGLDPAISLLKDDLIRAALFLCIRLAFAALSTALKAALTVFAFLSVLAFLTAALKATFTFLFWRALFLSCFSFFLACFSNGIGVFYHAILVITRTIKSTNNPIVQSANISK